MTRSPRHTPHGASESGIPRVLIVDDEPAILFAYRRLIEREGGEVDGCTGIEEAASLIRTRGYHCIVADLRLSGTDNEDGLELLRLAREVQPLTGFILVTGFGSQEVRRAALSLGASRYFEKPVLPEAILAALTELFAGRAAATVGTVGENKRKRKEKGHEMV